MTRRLVYAVRPLRNVKGAYEGKIEYMPGYTKSFIARDFAWILAEIEKALDNKIPTLSGAMDIQNERENEHD